MKKSILLLAMFSISLVGCDYDVELEPLNYVTFDSNELDLSVHEDTSESFDVTVYTGNTTGSDRTFTVNVDESSTLDPGAYTLPASVTVPANANEVTFTVEVTGSGIDDFGDTLVLSLGKEQGAYTGHPFAIDITKLCDFEISGDYTNASGWFDGAEYAVEVQAGSSANEYVVKDMFEDGTDITFTVNEDFSITVPKQDAWVHGTFGQASVQGRAGSKVEPCIGTVTLVLNHTVSAGSFGVASEVLTK